MKRIDTAEEVAKAAPFLASDHSSYIMRIVLTVNGEMTCKKIQKKNVNSLPITLKIDLYY